MGQIVLAFDGLDEILDTSLRRDFVEIVVGFCDQFPLCPVCVTSRHVGYEEARLPDVFEEVYLERFDDREVKEYVEKFLRVVANCTKKEAHDGAAEFLNQTEKNARDLRQNPLLLGLMSWLFYMKGDVPTNRPEIYGECAMLMFEKWDQRRGIEAKIPHDFDMLHLFSELAAKIYGDADLEGGVDSTWLRRQIKAYFERQYEERPRAHATANLLVKFITGRSWVMSEFGQEVFRFTHRTFLEYFFARHLDELYEGVEALLAILRPRIPKGEWDVVSHLALQLKAHRHARRTEEAIVALRHLLQDSVRLTDRRRASVMRFTATALEYLPGAETGVRALVSDLYRTAVAVAKSKPSEAAAAAGAAGCGAKERRDVAQKAISEHLSHSLQQGGSSEVLLACTVLSRMERGRYSIPEEIRAAVLTRAKCAVMAKARQDAFLAGVYLDWYGTDFDELFGIHGLHMFFGRTAPDDPTGPEAVLIQSRFCGFRGGLYRQRS